MKAFKYLTAAAILIMAAQSATAATYYVKPGGGGTQTGDSPANAFASIGAAVAASNLGTTNTILVAQGTYTEVATPVILTTATSLLGGYALDFLTSAPATNPSVIDGQDLRSGLRVGSTSPNISANLVKIVGFKFIRCRAIGDAANNLHRGGGIGIHVNTGTIHDDEIAFCQFEDCYALDNGAAVWVQQQGPTLGSDNNPVRNHKITLRDSTITSSTCEPSAINSQTLGNGRSALYFQRGGSTNPVTVLKNVIIKDCISANNSLAINNTNASPIIEMSSVLIYNCHNTKLPATAGDGDGGILFVGGRNSSFVVNSTIANCSAPNFLWNNNAVTNTSAGNRSQGPGTNTFVIANNIFANNVCTTFSGASNNETGTEATLFIQRDDAALGSIWKNNLFFNNTGFTRLVANDSTGAALDFAATPDAMGNTVVALTVDPLFVNAAVGDYRLQDASPAINAGVETVTTKDATDNIVTLPTHELGGGSRVTAGNAPKGGAFDLGAYETSPVNAIHGWTLY